MKAQACSKLALLAFLGVLSASCDVISDAGQQRPDYDELQSMTAAERQALCWKADTLRLRFAGEIYDVPNDSVTDPLRDTDIAWKAPGQEGKPDWTHCQFPENVPHEVVQFELHGDTGENRILNDGAMLLSAILIDDLAVNSMLAAGRGEEPEIGPVHLTPRELREPLEWLSYYDYIGKRQGIEQELFYYAGYNGIARADCRDTDPKSSDIPDRFNRYCALEYALSPARFNQRGIRMLAHMLLPKGKEPELARNAGILAGHLLDRMKHREAPPEDSQGD